MKKDKIKETLPIIIYFIIIYTLIITNMIKKYPTDLDELWNYNTARCIKNGLIPYKNISMITTPLLPTIVAIILKITTDQLIVFRIISATLSTFILLMVYLIFRELNINKCISLILTSFMSYILFNYFTLDYNFFALFLMLIIEFFEIKNYKNEKHNSQKNNIIIGIIAGMIICTKQTIGLFVAIYILLNEYIYNHKNKKELIQNELYRIIGIFIPTGIFLIWLLITNSFGDFVDYAILGIRTFNNYISYNNLFNNENKYISKLAIIVPIYFIITILYSLVEYMLSKKKNKTSKKNYINLLTLASLPMLIVVYPIADNIHFLIGNFQAIICIEYIVYLITKFIYKKINTHLKKYIKITITVFIILFVTEKAIFRIINNTSEYKEIMKNDTHVEHFSHIPVKQQFKQRLDNIGNYITEKERNGYTVIIADAEACVYNIPMNRYNKNYDMFLKGNIGKKGEQGIIENIQKSKNTIYLIKKEEYMLNWQSPINAIDFIRNNLEFNGTVDIFDVYIK